MPWGKVLVHFVNNQLIWFVYSAHFLHSRFGCCSHSRWSISAQTQVQVQAQALSTVGLLCGRLPSLVCYGLRQLRHVIFQMEPIEMLVWGHHSISPVTSATISACVAPWIGVAPAINVEVMGCVSLLVTRMCGEKVAPIQHGKVQNVSNCAILE